MGEKSVTDAGPKTPGPQFTDGKEMNAGCLTGERAGRSLVAGTHVSWFPSVFRKQAGLHTVTIHCGEESCTPCVAFIEEVAEDRRPVSQIRRSYSSTMRGQL